MSAKIIAIERKVINVDVTGICSFPIKGNTSCVISPWTLGINIPIVTIKACHFLGSSAVFENEKLSSVIIPKYTSAAIQYL